MAGNAWKWRREVSGRAGDGSEVGRHACQGYGDTGAVSDERAGPIAECVQALDVQGRTTQGVKTLSSFCSAMLPCEKRKTEGECQLRCLVKGREFG